MFARLQRHFKTGFLRELNGVDLSPFRPLGVKVGLSLRQIHVLRVLKQNESAPAKLIARKIGVHTNAVRHDLVRLRQMNLIS